jgi:hypothetical protein
MSSCIFSGSKRNISGTVGTLGNRLQSGEMQGSSGSSGRLKLASSSRSSVGVLDVEDAGRVTQGDLEL